MNKYPRIISLFLIFFLLVFSWAVIRNAWISEDAYITLRTVDNFIHGYGLTWNPGERVQTYTHPLWMLLLSAIYYFTHEVYYSTLFLSIAISLLAVILFAFQIVGNRIAILGITVLIFSKAFVDYSTSGLENPLSNLILTLFFLIYLRRKANFKTLFFLFLLTALSLVNRLDTVLLFLPPLVYVLFKTRRANGLFAAVLGLSPFIAWEIFSLFYYGFPFPNTAYAKLNTGITDIQLIRQGLLYLLNSVQADPLTLLIIVLGIIIPLRKPNKCFLPFSLGIILYLIYVVKIGGCFMSGRFLGVPLFCAVMILCSCRVILSNRQMLIIFSAIVLVGLISPHPTLFGRRDYKISDAGWDANGIADERAFYYSQSGLLQSGRANKLMSDPWVRAGKQARAEGIDLVVSVRIGLFGFFAGPRVHIIDLLALGDPLLSRLPALENPKWRVGHFQRLIPKGYVETLQTGENQLDDKNLAEYYDKLALITRGKLWDLTRLVTIWNMNTGKYCHLIDRHFYRRFRPGQHLIGID